MIRVRGGQAALSDRLRALCDLLENALALGGSTAVTSILGVTYWWVAARFLDASSVGYGSAAISAATLLGTIGMVDYGSLLLGRVASSGTNTARLDRHRLSRRWWGLSSAGRRLWGTWAPRKLEVQLAMMEQRDASSANVICASRIRLVDGQGRASFVVPARLIRAGETVADYLFVRRRLRWGRPSYIDRPSCARRGWRPRPRGRVSASIKPGTG